MELQSNNYSAQHQNSFWIYYHGSNGVERTSPKPEFPANMNYQQGYGSPNSSASPFSDLGVAYSPMSEGGDSSQSQPALSPENQVIYVQDNSDEFLNRIFGDHVFPDNAPHLEIIEQPHSKFRFRYRSEMTGTHGCILGQRSDKSKRRYPTVKLTGYTGKAYIRCTLRSDKSPFQLHAHHLVVRNGNEDKEDPHDMEVSSINDYTASFQGMCIIHTAKKFVKDELIRKIKEEKKQQMYWKNPNSYMSPKDVDIGLSEITSIREDVEKSWQDLNLNVVCLQFEAYANDERGRPVLLCSPVWSSPIHNMKSAQTGDLKITRISRPVSSCAGNDEVFMFVEKVCKKNIKVKFFEVDEEGNETWSAFGQFSELDVHHQYAIALRTPPYKNKDIRENVEVYIQLYRCSDGDSSDALKFTYKPRELSYITSRKRARPTEDFGTRSFNSVSSPMPNFQQTGNWNIQYNNSMTVNPNVLSGMMNQQRISTDHIVPALNPNELLTTDQFEAIIADLDKEDYFSLPMNDVETDSPTNRRPPKDRSALLRRGTEETATAPLEHGMQQVKIHDGPRHIKKSKTSGETLKNIPIDGQHLAQRVALSLGEGVQGWASSGTQNELLEKIHHLFALQTDDGENALHTAVIYQQYKPLKEMVTVLFRLQDVEPINAKNISEQTPLHLAVLQGSDDMVKLLIQNGADPNILDSNGDSPFHLAVRSSSEKCLDELLAESNYRSKFRLFPNIKCLEGGFTAIHLSILNQDLGLLKKLVSAGVDVNELDNSSGRTALHMAVELKCPAITKYLLRKTRVRVNEQNYAGNTALHIACVMQSVELVAMLMEAKADPSIENFRRKMKKEEEEDNEDLPEVKTENEESCGYTAIDLAESNPEILALLQRYCPPAVSTPKDVVIKEEPIDEATPVTPEDDIPQGIDSGVDLQSRDLTSSDLDSLDPIVHKKLVKILDPPSSAWQELAHLLEMGYLLNHMKSHSSPTTYLLNTAATQNVTLEELRDALSDLGQVKAVKILNEVLSHSS